MSPIALMIQAPLIEEIWIYFRHAYHIANAKRYTSA